jgi:hypothetical protein
MSKVAYKPVSLAASVLSGLVAGAIFAVVKAAVDRGAAEGTRRLTGTWPGEDGS